MRTSCTVPVRVQLAALVFLGFMCIYMTRINLSVALVAMVRHEPHKADHLVALDEGPSQQEDHSPQAASLVNGSLSLDNTSDSLLQRIPPALEVLNCLAEDPEVSPRVQELESLAEEKTPEVVRVGSTAKGRGGGGGGGEESEGFEWDSFTQGVILGSFFYGYLTTQLPGGRLAELYGTRRIFGGAVLASGLLSLLTPVAASCHYGALVALRILLGIVQGVSFPSMHAMVARWIPPLERSKFIAFSYLGSTFGVIVTFPLCGLLISQCGWESAFYTTGALALAWASLWFVFAHDSPAAHPTISPEERKYIQSSLDDTSAKPPPVPWRSVATSLPVAAIVVADIGNNWGLYFLLTELPSYLWHVFKFSIKQNGLLSALPYLSRWLLGMFMSMVADGLRASKVLSTRNTRRLFTFISMTIPAGLMVAVGYAGSSALAAVVLLTLACGLNGGMSSGYFANHIDIAPNYAGTLMGVSNCLATVPGFLAPMTVAALTPDQSLDQWQKVFWIAGSIYFVSSVFFIAFCAGNVQPWNTPTPPPGEVVEEGGVDQRPRALHGGDDDGEVALKGPPEEVRHNLIGEGESV
ncbi:sialin-like [Oratosquilla oratoria]|uniref:sialin-like n=1 Tax=Oratosquilla oratoria TaxID=337810 RepID=UPI003F777288